MITLYGFGPAFTLVDASPFVVKVDLFLRLSGLEYKFVGKVANLSKSPKSKLPFINDDGEKIADSDFIIKYLSEKYQITLDQHLSAEQKAQASLYTKALDESLYWCLVYSRWSIDDSWREVKSTLFANLPIPVQWIVPNILRKKTLKTLQQQGYGRHSETELLLIADSHFSALSTLLGDQSYFFGEQISTFDVIAYAFLAEFISTDLSNSFNTQANKYDNLVRYCQGIEQQYYANKLCQ